MLVTLPFKSRDQTHWAHEGCCIAYSHISPYYDQQSFLKHFTIVKDRTINYENVQDDHFNVIAQITLETVFMAKVLLVCSVNMYCRCTGT